MTFSVKSGEEIYVLRASSTLEFERWLRLLSAVIRAGDAGPGQKPLSAGEAALRRAKVWRQETVHMIAKDVKAAPHVVAFDFPAGFVKPVIKKPGVLKQTQPQQVPQPQQNEVENTSVTTTSPDQNTNADEVCVPFPSKLQSANQVELTLFYNIDTAETGHSPQVRFLTNSSSCD